MGRAGWGAGKERFSSNYSTVINMVQDRANNSWSERCLQFMVMIKNQSQPLLVHWSETEKKNSSQIHINTRLQLLLLLLLLLLCKVFHLFLQGLATASQPLTSTRSATATGGRHKAWKSFSAGASPWNTLHCTQGGAWPVLFSHRAALVLPIQIAECVHS